MTAVTPSRRRLIGGAACLGVTMSLIGQRAYAEPTLAERRLVVIVCRGGLDGLSLAPPVGDPDYSRLRGPIAIAPFGEPGGALRLDATFGLHPSLVAVHALALKGQARIAPAVATPDRARSHFEAQDVLESGASGAYAASSGWLNRALETIALPQRPKAISIGPTTPLILRGHIQTASWSPGGLGEKDRRLPGILQDLYADDALLGPALAAGLANSSIAREVVAEVVAAGSTDAPGATMGWRHPMEPPLEPAIPRAGLSQARRLGNMVGGFLTQPDGARVAVLSIDGFDTHANQGAAVGVLATRLSYVDDLLDALSASLGPAWSQTVVVMVTEFGRTAHVNGTGGTDHGTASTALILGGAIRKGGIIGDWPTLGPTALFEGRDTSPTLDMRSLFKGLLRDHLGLDRTRLDADVFPDSARALPLKDLVV